MCLTWQINCISHWNSIIFILRVNNTHWGWLRPPLWFVSWFQLIRNYRLSSARETESESTGAIWWKCCKISKVLKKYVKVCTHFQKYAKIYQSMPEYAKASRCTPKCAKLLKIRQSYAKVHYLKWQCAQNLAHTLNWCINWSKMFNLI